MNTRYYNPKTHQVNVVSYYYESIYKKDMSYSWNYYDAAEVKKAQQKGKKLVNSSYYNPKTHQVYSISYYYEKAYKYDMSYSWKYYKSSTSYKKQATSYY